MGALHAGHARLIDAARAGVRDRRGQHLREPAAVRSRGRPRAVPAHARSRPGDCARAHGVDLVFAPTPREMYPAAADLHRSMSGRWPIICAAAFRPGHFEGVATVVMKLLQIVQPDAAYFGEKDAQQLAIVRRLVADFNVPDRDRRCADGARSRRPGDELAQRASERRGAGAGAGAVRALCEARPLDRGGRSDPGSDQGRSAARIPADRCGRGLEYLGDRRSGRAAAGRRRSPVRCWCRGTLGRQRRA